MPSGELPSRVIFLNGTSSSGKTTLARSIQDESDVPFVYWGIDTLFDLVPPNWGGGPLARRRREIRTRLRDPHRLQG
ncbi:phosphotransferase-like protein [Nocardia colli]|uniref:phosphotransferase-like protein n=1 Tax=Nocardia colli TaxID=2545717 RepID=UPI0035E26393